MRELPGVRHKDDTARLNLIRGEAMCCSAILFLFNAKETDNAKEEQALASLMTGLKAGGRGLETTVFAMNRVDTFLSDRNGEEDRCSELLRRRNQIQSTAAEQGLSAGEIEIVPLSAGPAFCIEALCWSGARMAEDDRVFLQKQAVQQAKRLLPPSLMNRLPRRKEEWSRRQWRWLFRRVKRESGYPALMQRLRKQVQRFEGRCQTATELHTSCSR